MSGLKREIKCIRCKRPLHDRKARELGIGPVCAKKNPGYLAHYLAEREGQMRFFDEDRDPLYKADGLVSRDGVIWEKESLMPWGGKR